MRAQAYTVSLTATGKTMHRHVGPGIVRALLALLPAGALAGPVETLQPGQWYQFPGSRIRDVLPDPRPEGNPRAITGAWSGGAFDTRRNRLLVFGGGHHDYAGNEVYAFEVASGRWTRLSNPSAAPVSVHSYDQLEYLPRQDALFAAGGSTWPNGNASRETWLFDLTSNAWRQAANIPGKVYGAYEFNMTTAYDAAGEQVLMEGYSAAASYRPGADGWTLQGSQPTRSLGHSGAFDPTRRLFVSIGRGTAYRYTIDAGGHFSARANLAASGATEIESCDAPGLDYDPVSDRLVAWCSGAEVYSLELGSRVWTRHAGTGSVSPGAPQADNYHGTFGRWRYMPAANAFLLATTIDSDVYAYRFSSGGTTAPSTAPAAAPVAARPAGTAAPAAATGTAGSAAIAAPVAARTDAPAVPAASGATTADADWLARARAPGVTNAVGFDTQQEWLTRVWDKEGCSADYAPGCRANAWDSGIKASGAGSVRFDIRSNTGQGGGGNIVVNFSEDLQTQFGANEEFWLQWRQRFDPYVIEHDYEEIGGGGGGEWKQVIIAQGNRRLANGRVLLANACSEAQIVVVNAGNRDFPSSYIECGRYNNFEDGLGTTSKGSVKITRQNARNHCIFFPRNMDTSGCLRYYPNEWMTFMVHLRMGPEGRAVSSAGRKSQPGFVNSSYDLYVARQGEPLALAHHQDGLVIPRGQYWNAATGVDPDVLHDPGYASGWSAADGHPQAEYGKVWLTPYHTQKDPKETHEKASLWYDEVIISSKPIASPGPAARQADRGG